MKVIQSKSKLWQGSVTIADPLTMPQVLEIEKVLEAAGEIGEGRVRLSVLDNILIPAILACVEKWELSNFPEQVSYETFPASPRRASSDLLRQIWDEVYKVYLGEIDIPNG